MAQIFTGMIMVKKIIAVLLGTLFIYFGFCLVIKAGVGLDAWDALLLTASAVLGMKVGTLAILFSIFLIAGQLIMEGRNFRPVQFLQLLNVFFGGNILNYFVYSLFSDLRFKSYPFRIVIATFSYLLIALGVIIIMESRLIRNPLEGFCQVVTDKCGGRMGHLRQMCDWVFIAIVLILSFSFKTEITIREGTIICMVIFGPALDFLRNPVRKGMNKLEMNI